MNFAMAKKDKAEFSKMKSIGVWSLIAVAVLSNGQEVHKRAPHHETNVPISICYRGNPESGPR